MRRWFHLSLMLLACGSTLCAQPIFNKVETACDGLSRTIYGEIGEGRVLVVVGTAVDCGSCIAEAPSIMDFALRNAGGISVWGAMNRLSGSTQCGEVDGWNSQHNWSSIFTFVDTGDFWVNGAFTYYTVINPDDSSIAYRGPQGSLARDTAEAMAKFTGVREPKAKVGMVHDVFPNPFTEEIQIAVQSSRSVPLEVVLFDILGKEVTSRLLVLRPGHQTVSMDLSDIMLEQNVYLLRARLADETYTFRLVKE